MHSGWHQRKESDQAKCQIFLIYCSNAEVNQVLEEAEKPLSTWKESRFSQNWATQESTSISLVWVFLSKTIFYGTLIWLRSWACCSWRRWRRPLVNAVGQTVALPSGWQRIPWLRNLRRLVRSLLSLCELNVEIFQPLMDKRSYFSGTHLHA